MMRRTTWIAAGVGLTAILATGWLVAQTPNKPVDLPMNPPVPNIAVPLPTNPGVGVPNPPPLPGQVIQAGFTQSPVSPSPVSPAVTPPSTPPQIPILPGSYPPTPVPSTTVGQPPKATGDLVQELIQIINETKSVDTFYVTTKLLEDMGGKARAAVPSIIRNAERLELFKDSLLQTEKDSEKQKKAEMASMIVESLAKIMSVGQSGSNVGRQTPLATPAPVSPTTSKNPDPLVAPMSGRLDRPPVVNDNSELFRYWVSFYR